MIWRLKDRRRQRRTRRARIDPVRSVMETRAVGLAEMCNQRSERQLGKFSDRRNAEPCELRRSLRSHAKKACHGQRPNPLRDIRASENR